METTVLVDVTSCTTYIGEAFTLPDLQQSASVWKILRIQQATSGTTFFYADGQSGYTKSWQQRASFAYSVS